MNEKYNKCENMLIKLDEMKEETYNPVSKIKLSLCMLKINKIIERNSETVNKKLVLNKH